MEMQIQIPVTVLWKMVDGHPKAMDIFVKDSKQSIYHEVSQEEIDSINEYLSEIHDLDHSAMSEDLDIEAGVDVDFSFHKGTKNPHAGPIATVPWDPAEITLTKVMLGNTNILKSLPMSLVAKIEAKASDHADLGEAKSHLTAMKSIENKLYKRQQGGKMTSKLGKKGKSIIPGFSYWFKKT